MSLKTSWTERFHLRRERKLQDELRHTLLSEARRLVHADTNDLCVLPDKSLTKLTAVCSSMFPCYAS